MKHSVTEQIALFAGNSNSGMIAGGLLLVFAVVLLSVVAILAPYIRLWIRAHLAGAGLGFIEILSMTFKKVPPRPIVESKIMAVQAGLSDPELTTLALESHYLAGGNVPQVIKRLIEARDSNVKLSFREACNLDLSGKDAPGKAQSKTQQET